VGVMDTTLHFPTKVDAVATARRLGFDGLEVSIGLEGTDGRLPLTDPALQAEYLTALKTQNVPLASLYLNVLHVNCLKNDALARRRVADGIEITRRMHGRILMMVFFGKCALQGQADLDAVTGPLKDLAPDAARAGVILGFENTLSAQDNARVLDRVASDALKVFYDVGNSTNIGGFDVPSEIRWLGRDRICQFHLKDKGYMGAGKVDFPAVMQAIKDIGFRGYVVLETNSPSGSVEDDLQRNLKYTRRLIANAARA
jgi:L-ribulose-5-phosphate 3-epimerase